MNERLADAWAKHRWACKHAEYLQQAITDSEPHALRLDTEHNLLTSDTIAALGLGNSFEAVSDTGSGLAVLSARAAAHKPVPENVALHLGDALNCFRGALDYAAYALVEVGSKPEAVTGKSVTKIQFPITHNKQNANDWKGVAEQQVPGVSGTHLRVVRDYQPFVRSKHPEADPLARLRELGGKDKHRRLRLLGVGAQWGAFKWEITDNSFQPVFKPIDSAPKDGLVKPGDYIAHLIGVPHGDAWRDIGISEQITQAGVAVEPFDIYVIDLLDAINKNVTEILEKLDPLVGRVIHRRSPGVPKK